MPIHIESIGHLLAGVGDHLHGDRRDRRRERRREANFFATGVRYILRAPLPQSADATRRGAETLAAPPVLLRDSAPPPRAHRGPAGWAAIPVAAIAARADEEKPMAPGGGAGNLTN
jgi:hypothetical protein